MTTDRLSVIHQRLSDALQTTQVEVIDDSADHVGHEGSRGGAGHYTVIVTSELFTGKTRIQMHQMVYAALNDMIGPEIHAIRIQTHAL